MCDGEAVWTYWMPCGIAVLMDGRWGPELFLSVVPYLVNILYILLSLTFFLRPDEVVTV